MNRTVALGAAFFLALSAFAFQAVQLPGRVLACYCETLTRLAEVDLDQPLTVVVGTVGPSLPDRTPIVVDAWFHGPFPAGVVWVRGGLTSSSSCDALIRAGERRVLVLYRDPTAPGGDGLYSTDVCAPSGVIGTPEGDALLAEAAAMFGADQQPRAQDPAPTAPVDLWAWLTPTGLAWLAAAAGTSLALLLLLVLLARRRPANR